MKHTVIVTGGTKGLGREIALAFARKTCFVLALYAGDDTAAREFETALAQLGGAGLAIKQDICSPNPALWNRPEIQEADHLTFIHNACAAFSPTPMHQLTWSDFEKNHLVAIKGAWECSQPLIRLMVRKKAGTIINILSSGIEGAAPKGFSAYITAKHALRGFTLALAAEYSIRGLKIFSVSPGFMDTTLTSQWDDRLRQTIREHSERITIPTAAAGQIYEFAMSAEVPGKGENYSV